MSEKEVIKSLKIPKSLETAIIDLGKKDASYKEINFSKFTREAIEEKLKREQKK